MLVKQSKLTKGALVLSSSAKCHFNYLCSLPAAWVLLAEEEATTIAEVSFGASL